MMYLYAYRRRLPHFRALGKAYFVTFRAAGRRDLSVPLRDIALDCCVYEHRKSCWLDSAVVMPNHVHFIATPSEEWTLERIVERMKRVSSHRIKKALGLRDVWEREYFDHMLRSDESMRQKSEYICNNPVRAGLVSKPENWRWLWRSWVDAEQRHCVPRDR